MLKGPKVADSGSQKVEHAGYARYILNRNPRRYNEYGEELEDSETDEEADADAADQNAYSGIRLEGLTR
jgi:RXT2-like, N-terminal